ncbi:MAG TPA: fused MFS/spermidine synthase [Vicinamibacteria bacterium]|nr:fused MFS/spermidine synthase [Vicinamibacteria bacterium]
MVVSATTIFLGAFLLFVVQPLTARRLLPWFGGSPAVWIVSLLFFQVALLAGYGYAHVLTERLSRHGQALFHVVLVLVALAFLPIGPHEPVETGASDPTWDVLAMLASSLAVPLVVVSSTNPLLQRWLASANVYRLFAVSNLGSLLGLWCYPFLLEPWTGLETQAWLWSVGFGLYAGSSVLVAARAWRHAADLSERESESEASVGVWTRFLWLGLAGTGAVMLMATSNQLTRNVAAFPFLWVLPLSLYLISFIVAFSHDRWYLRSLWASVYVVSVLVVLHLLGQSDEPPFWHQLAAYSVNLLAACMICHGELARLRPASRRLTRFYLHVAFGGALGGALVSLAAPAVFRGYWEYPLGLFAVYVLGGLSVVTGQLDIAEGHRSRILLFLAGGAIAFGALLFGYVERESGSTTLMQRSFFGVLRIYDHNPQTRFWERYLWNGPVSHGGQMMVEGRRNEPLLYYGPDSGVGVALGFRGEPWSSRGRHIGVVGLGTGTLAALALANDVVTFYELNPDVVDVAREYFYYLDESQADVRVVVGDARRSLSTETGKLDILVIDAFTGDAIPVHLLTREAFALYDERLDDEGILAVHVSNLHFDLKPVVRAHAESLGAAAVFVRNDADDETKQYLSDWVLVTRNAAFLSSAKLQSRMTPWRADLAFSATDFDWTDDYSNLLRVVKTAGE